VAKNLQISIRQKNSRPTDKISQVPPILLQFTDFPIPNFLTDYWRTKKGILSYKPISSSLKPGHRLRRKLLSASLPISNLYLDMIYNIIKAGVLQGSILAPLLYSVYKADISLHPHTTLSPFADDKAILSKNPDPIVASSYLQVHLN
jgi:hypothetical protein